MKIEVIFEDDDIVVVNKPAGMVVHPAPGRREGSLAEELARSRPGMAAVGSRERPGVVHRLDIDDAAYLEKVKAPCLVQPHDFYEKELEKFLCHIIDQPIEEARRLNRYGFQTIHRFRMRRLYAIQDALAAPVKCLRKIKACLKG